ncbi:malate synthase A [Enterovibrio sp. ZSDZ35]|uniref:malate synthase n=2 Tax=Enterovibrio qingdaonensis TaxID=2899818 RepID=A0ABT5QGD9_9GAMM|nr:malate synthase A [Enterovibrio sp. ZSDZ35]MDD1779763.1 malate synthase A [Enterovibrio sp. ZSDZ35]
MKSNPNHPEQDAQTQDNLGKIQVTGSLFSDQAKEILSEDALAFVAALCDRFARKRDALLSARKETQTQMDDGALPQFREDTAPLRDDPAWKVAPIPDDLLDRRVEITGPIDRKMVINALNSGANVFMCCFEDASSPTWENMVNGQINMRDANNGSIAFTDPKNGKHYQLVDKPATLIHRPRGLHLEEAHIVFDGKPIPAALMDFGLYFFHNYQSRKQRGQGVYFYLPKLESMEEAAWWEAVFDFTESYFTAESGTIRATVLIETLPAVFQMEEILYAMRKHIVGMNCGRWDYIFSYIKTLKNHTDRILPDRHAIGMDQPFLDAYSKRLIQTCHRRGALAIGGMSAFIPSKDPDEMARVTQKVIEDKRREATNGHDGTWVAHPHLVTLARDTFDQYLDGATNQRCFMPDGTYDAALLLQPCQGPKDENGVRKNIRIAVLYMEAWLRGIGCVPIYGMMEDAATAEISRANIWQWLKHQVSLDDGRTFTTEMFKQWLNQEVADMKAAAGNEEKRKFEEASAMFYSLSTDKDFADFLTIPCYEKLE